MISNGNTLSNQHEKPGDSLRRMRMRLGLTTRKVAELSRTVAAGQGSDEFSISHARLVQIENEESVPSLYKLFTLSSVYGVPVQKLFSMYLDLEKAEPLHAAMALPQTHIASFDGYARKTIPFPVQFNSTARNSESESLSNIAQAWGEVPVPLLEHLKQPRSRYGFIGLSDFTMSPLIPPGSVVRLAECHKVAKPLAYRTELERPVYFLESRAGYVCSWCEVGDGRLFSIPHPLSPCRPKSFAISEVDVIGRVTGVALRFESHLDRTDFANCERATAG
jgi:transcriptional regulator with XRE-family HTH domain